MTSNGVTTLKRIELALRMVALGLVLLLVLINLPARGDDAACVVCDAESQSPTSKVATFGIELAVSAPAAVIATSEAFLIALNAERQARGLQPVIHSDQMAGTAARNNAECAARNRLGHWVLDGLGQCSGWNYPNYAAALRGWANSPAHAAIIFAPSLSTIGYSQSGPWHTVSTWCGGYVESSPAAAQVAPKGTESATPAAACQSSVPGPMYWPLSQGCGNSQTVPLLHGGSPGRSGLFARLFGRARAQVQFGVQVQF